MLVEDPSKTAKGEISEIYMKTLEKAILEAPQYYLWSHKRWKLNPVSPQSR
jgi:KDO2-lipid IV(A) lauroyltransferase